MNVQGAGTIMISPLRKKKSKKSKRGLSLDCLNESNSSLSLTDLDESQRSEDSASSPIPPTSGSALMSPSKASSGLFRRRRTSASPRKKKGGSNHKRTSGRKTKALSSIDPLLIQDDLVGISSSAVDDKNSAMAKARKSKKKLRQLTLNDSSHSLSSRTDDSARSFDTESTSSSEAHRALTSTLSPKRNSKKTMNTKRQPSSSSLETVTTADTDESWASFEEEDADTLKWTQQLRASLQGSPRPTGVLPKLLARAAFAEFELDLDDDDDDDDYVKVVDDGDEDEDDDLNEEKKMMKKKKKKKKKKDLPSIQEEDLNRSTRSSRSRRRKKTSTSSSRRTISNSPSRRRMDDGGSSRRRSSSSNSMRCNSRKSNNNRRIVRPMVLRSCLKGSRVDELCHFKQKRNVRFLEMVTITPIIPLLELVQKKSELWFRQKDYDKIIRRTMNIALKVKEGKKTRKSLRGLENFLNVKTERYAAWSAVLVEQEVQRLANKRDENRIHQVYVEASATCQAQAQERGKEDSEAIQDYLWETL